ncbi:hypothetical protein ACFWFI_03715 [Streptomyces sp. NPDC060209]|uniref:hypothetical protein n=1 Tax=Streptomyces sp. NPDC060209 TaxID=3347073 RepID=UPI003662D4B8
MSALPAEVPALPAWNTPVIAPSLVLAPGPVPVSIYADDLWHLAPLVANPSALRPHLDWARFPDALRPQVQLAAWLMINTPLPASVLVGHPIWHSHLGPHGIHDTVLRWQRFTVWLHHQGLSELNQVTDGVWAAWADHLARQPGAHRGNVTKDRQVRRLKELRAADAQEIARLKADVEALVGALHQSTAENRQLHRRLAQGAGGSGSCRSRGRSMPPGRCRPSSCDPVGPE